MSALSDPKNVEFHVITDKDVMLNIVKEFITGDKVKAAAMVADLDRFSRSELAELMDQFSDVLYRLS